MRLRSPTTGAVLARDGHALTAPGERWPVIDDIAFLRAGRERLAMAALARLDSGDVAGATVCLLADRDDWASGPGPVEADLRRLVAERDRLSFREAMRLLAFGPVADYLAHRWSDPTFLSGLALADAYWPGRPPRVLEVACGTGQFLRAFAPHAAQVTGIDVVWSKLWLARHWVAADAALVCCDAAHDWPLPAGKADLVFCHDAFYFLPAKPHVAAEMRRCAAANAMTLVGHAHNALADNHSSGAPLAPGAYAALFAPATLFDDAALTAASISRTAPEAADAAALAGAPAISLAHPAAAPRAVMGRFDPAAGSLLRLNALYGPAANGRALAFPSARYAAEYATLATYPREIAADLAEEAAADAVDPELVRRRVYVDLPERW